jgi:large subunit ribosomal protein L13
MKTDSAKAPEIVRKWFLVDAEGVVLGRAATAIARVLRGKHQTFYTPHLDTGDFVIVVNAGKVRLTGRKESDKMYHHHTGWVGSVVSQNAQKVRERAPERLIEAAVGGMLPRGPLGRRMYKKLKVYAGAEHPHSAQQPKPLAV